jgi:probable F420-dependent oxidoreductase
MIRLGLALPNLSPLGTRENLAIFAREVERLGFDSVWVTERLLYPLQPKQSIRGRPLEEKYKTALDPLDTLIYTAAVTEKIRLGTSLLDFPMYAPAPLAKRIATLDVLSGGRAVIGAGLGWSEEEFTAHNVSFEKRGARMSEFIHALNVLWGPDPVEFHGQYYEVPRSYFNPKPLQQPRPPLVLGGFALEALQRAARLADGFNPVALPNADEAEPVVRAARQAWKDAGRGPAKPEIVVRVNHGYIADQPLGNGRLFLTGSVEQVKEDVKKLAGWGATEVFFDLVGKFGNLPDGLQWMIEQAHLLRGVV